MKYRNTHQKVQSPTSSPSAETLNLDSSNNEPTTNEELTGTPFRIVHIPEHGWFITLGMQRITEKIYQTRKEALQPVVERDWNFLCNAMVTLIDQIITLKQIQNNKTQQQ